MYVGQFIGFSTICMAGGDCYGQCTVFPTQPPTSVLLPHTHPPYLLKPPHPPRHIVSRFIPGHPIPGVTSNLPFPSPWTDVIISPGWSFPPVTHGAPVHWRSTTPWVLPDFNARLVYRDEVMMTMTAPLTTTRWRWLLYERTFAGPSVFKRQAAVSWRMCLLALTGTSQHVTLKLT